MQGPKKSGIGTVMEKFIKAQVFILFGFWGWRLGKIEVSFKGIQLSTCIYFKIFGVAKFSPLLHSSQKLLVMHSS